MPDLASHFGDLIKKLMGVADVSDSAQNLMNALRIAQRTAIGVTANGPSPEEAMIKHLAGLDDKALRALGIDPLKLQLVLANAVGGVVAHPGPYEIDVGWGQSLINYYKYLDQRVPFPTHMQRANYSGVQDLVSDATGEIRIALVGDWGVAPSYPIAKKVIDRIASRNPHYVIHLGDVYYSGLPTEEKDAFFNTLWPFQSPTVSLALNSNHEMYSGGVGYYNGLLKDPRFTTQREIGYFALQNQNWLIVGLDTAYFARWSSRLYQDGTLGNTIDTDGMVQRNWFNRLLHDPAQTGKRVIILTHHDGFDIDPLRGGVKFKTLWTEMTGSVRGKNDPTQPGNRIGVHDWWWYWGHVHAPIVYERIFFSDNSSVTARCAGHGAVPYLPYPVNYANFGDGTFVIKWAETATENRTPTDGTDKDRAPNGYALLTLTGTTIKEEFFDEDGRSRWSNF
jgi:Calcineurin-like phosphoesterase